MPQYYNPYDTDQERYYSPETNTQEGPTQSIGPMLRTMGVAMLLNIGGAIATKHIMSATKSTLKSWSQNSASVIRKNFADKTIRTYQSFKKSAEPIRESITKTSVYKAGVERRHYLDSIKEKPGYALKRVSSAFKNPKTLAATTFGVWKRNVFGGMAVAYGVDSMLGFTREMGLEKKKIYDVPGQVSNFAKWVGYSSIGGLAMGAAGPTLGVIGGLGVKALQKTFSGAFGKQVLNNAAKVANNQVDSRYNQLLSKEALDFSTKAVVKGLHFGHNVAEAYRGLQDATKLAWNEIKTPGRSFGARTKSAIGFLGNAIKESKEVLKKKTVLPKAAGDYHGLATLNEFEQWSKKFSEGATKKEIGSSLDTFFANMTKLGNKRTPLQNIFGGVLQKATLKDVVADDKIDHILGNLRNVYSEHESKALMNKILDLKVGDNIYRDWRNPKIKGGLVDLNFLDPIHMVKRAAAPILNYQMYAPIAKSWFSLADLTGTHKWITNSPTAFATRSKPNFKYGVGNLADQATEENALFIYSKGGKWAIFDGGLTKTVDTGRSLHYAHKSGKDKAWELKDITVNEIRKLKTIGMTAEYNDFKNKMDHKTQPSNKWFGFFSKAGIGVPEIASKWVGALRSRFQGRNNYKLEFSNIFNNDETALGLGRAEVAVPLLHHMYGHTSQTLARVARNRQAMQVVGEVLHNDDLAENILNQQTVLAKVRELALDGRYKNDNDVIKAIEDNTAFPRQSRHHKVIRSKGIFQDMTSEDIVRVKYVEDVFGKSLVEHADGKVNHPLLTIAPKLYSKGIITHQEKNALQLHAKLSVFQTMDGLFPNVSNARGTLRDPLLNVRRRAKANHWGMLNELTNFVANNELRSPGIINSQVKTIGTHIPYAHDDLPFVSTPDKGFAVIAEWAAKIMDKGTDVISEWSPIKKYEFSNHGFVGGAKYLGRTALTAASVFGAYRIVDTVTAANPLFDDTMFEEGITGAVADQAAKARLLLARAADVTGVTSTAKYFHGLAPYSESSIPGAFLGSALGAFAKMGPLGIAKSALMGAVINRIASSILPDLTKSYEELKEIYSGRQEVPIMKAPTWLLGGTPWEGSKVVGYSPNWYVRAKSRWQETDTLYGSAARRLIHEPLPILGFNIGDIIDPYYMERKHFFSRPYPITGGAFDEVPLVGGVLSSTIGRLIKPQKTMHQEYLTRGMSFGGEAGDPYGFAVRPPTIPENLSMMNRGSSDAMSTAGQAINKGQVSLMSNKFWAESASEDFLYDVQQFAGLKGFLAGSVAERIFDTNRTIPTLQTAGRMASMSRSYYDLNVGGLGVISEGIRRVIDKPEYRQYGLNPIPNMMPNWLPSHFLTGDPYEKILRGELRLPGSAYLATHTSVRRTMPARASMLGGNVQNIVQYFTGLIPPTLMEEFEILEKGTEFHQSIQNTLAAEGMLIQAETLVQDVKNDITGHVDAIIRDGKGGKGRRALEIKTINQAGFEKLDAPKDQHVGQLNFYLKQLGIKKGTFLYVNRDNPGQVKTFEINYNPSRFERDIRKLQTARSIAKTMMEEGVGDTLGYTYSWTDRLKILADVAPNSLEFKEAKQIVERQIKYGAVDRAEVSKYEQALKMKQARIRSFELYPNRFKGKVFSPDSYTNIQSINEDIKAGDEYTLPERMIGALWERFTNTNTFLTNKFFAVKDPLEHYKMTRLYGKEYKPWDEPIRGWIEPYARGMASKTDPFGGAISFGMGGMIFGGGPLGGVIGAGVGAAYGGLHGAYRLLSGTTYIPKSVQEKREIVSYFDAAKYERNNMLASLSQGLTQKQYLEQKNATLTAFNEGGSGATVANLFRGTSGFEKPYIEGFLNVRDPEERENILKYVPDDLAQALRRQWGANDNKDATENYVKQTSQDIAAGSPRYNFNRSIMDPSINLEDIKLKTVTEAGFDQFEFGLGWNEQMLRIQNSNREIQAATIERLSPSQQEFGQNISQSNLRGMINDVFSKSGIKASTQIYVDNSMDFNQVEVVIRRDRSRTIVNALNRREKYGI